MVGRVAHVGEAAMADRNKRSAREAPSLPLGRIMMRIPFSLMHILLYVSEGQLFYDERQRKWRMVDGSNIVGRFDHS
eukprot:9391593-Pyramimonas_sp.AAC.1